MRRQSGAPVKSPLPPLADQARWLCGSDPERTYRTIGQGMKGSASDLMPAHAAMLEWSGRPEKGTRADWTRSLEGRADAELEAVRRFYEAQPERPALVAMRPSERRRRAGEIIWDLVHYVRSLGP